MEKIKIKKLNEVYFGIECNPGIKMELKDHFAFYAPNYKFHPKYKSKIWDGKLHLYNLNTSKLYIGLFWEFFQFCESREYSIQIEDNPFFGNLRDTITPDEPSTKDVQILDSIQFKYDSLRDYQMSAVLEGLKRKRSIIQSATDFHNYSNKTLDNEFIHQIYAGKDKLKEAPIVISTWQSLQTMKKEQGTRFFFERFGCLIVDEVHGATAKVLTNIIEQCSTADYRFGFTGTIKDSVLNQLQLIGLFGPIAYV